MTILVDPFDVLIPGYDHTNADVNPRNPIPNTAALL